MNKIKIFGISDVGMVRTENEDSFLIIEENDEVLACVADGMGGHIGGRVASTTTVNTIKEYYNNNREKAPIEEIIEDSMILSNNKIKEKSLELGSGKSMGTTCTIAVINSIHEKENEKQKTKNELSVSYGHIGDSRLYHFSKNNIEQISKDHSMLQRLLDSGTLKPEDAEDYQYKNVIYKSLGGMDVLKLDPPEKFSINEGDILLLCSDGLTGYIKDDELLNIVKGKKDIVDAAKYMINLTKHRGGDDNITVVILEYGNYKRDKKIKLKKYSIVKRGIKKSPPKKRLAILLLLLIITMLTALLCTKIDLWVL